MKKNKDYFELFIEYDSRTEGEEDPGTGEYDHSYSYNTDYSFQKLFLNNQTTNNNLTETVLTSNIITEEEKENIYIPYITVSSGDSFVDILPDLKDGDSSSETHMPMRSNV